MAIGSLRHNRIAKLLALAAAFLAGAATAADDLLDPEQAFQFSARYIEPTPGDAGAVEIRYRIAEGYYLYRQKFAFSALPASMKFGTPQIPPGITKRDEFFGESQTHRRELVIRVPLEAPATGGFTLKAVSQGCADAGVCFLPQSHSVRIQPTAATSDVMPAVPARGKPTSRSRDRVHEAFGK